MSSSYSKIHASASSYIDELKSDLSGSKSQSKIKERYQIKILELLISLQETNTYLDRINRENMQLKRDMEDSKKELEKKHSLLQAVSQEKQQLMFEVKAQVNEIASLEQLKNKLESQRQQLKNSCDKQKAQLLRQVQSCRSRCRIQIEGMEKKVKQIQISLNSKCAQLIKAEQEKCLAQKRLMEENKANSVQYNKKLVQIQSDSEIRQKKIASDYQSKLSELASNLKQVSSSANQEKYNLSKVIQGLENKLKVLERSLKEIQNEKCQLEESQQALNKDIKQKQKQLKILRKQNADQAQKIVQVSEQNEQLKGQLSVSQTKRKQLQRRENELRNELQTKKDEQVSQNGIIEKQKLVIREMKEENKKLKQQIDKMQLKVKQLQSNLYKSGVFLEQERKKSNEMTTKLQYIQLANVKLNERIVLEEKNKDSIIKSVVTQKDMVERQNIKLLQLLEIKQNMIQSILSETGQISEMKLSELGVESKTKEKWRNILKQNLKEPSNRRMAVDKYLSY